MASTGKQELVLIRPNEKEHAEALIDLTAKVFAHDHWEWVDYCRREYLLGSHYDWPASTIGLVGTTMVTHWGIWGYRMRIGGAKVRVAGVGAVATHGRFRRRGLMARTALAGVEASRAAGYDVALLFGIPDLYHRFGFVRAWPRQTWTVRLDSLPAGPLGRRLRKARPAHRRDMDRLHNRTNARLTGTAVRPTFHRAAGAGEYVWTDPDGTVVGYVVIESGSQAIKLVDFAGEAADVLSVLAALLRRRGLKEVRMSALHYESELARAVRQRDCRLEVGYSKSGGAMVCVLNLASTLGKMAGELSSRLKHSPMARWRGRLLIADPRERVTLNIDRGEVTIAGPGKTKHAIRGGEEIAQLLIGADAPAEIAQAGRMRLRGDARSLMNVLFPNQHPLLSRRDSF